MMSFYGRLPSGYWAVGCLTNAVLQKMCVSAFVKNPDWRVPKWISLLLTEEISCMARFP